MKNYYNILGLSSYEDSQDIILAKYKEATSRLCAQSFSKDVRDQLIEINEAFLVLSDSKLKKKYDYALSTDSHGETLLNNIAVKSEKAVNFISSKLDNAQKKRMKNKWPAIICGFFILPALGPIIRTCTEALMQEKSSNAVLDSIDTSANKQSNKQDTNRYDPFRFMGTRPAEMNTIEYDRWFPQPQGVEHLVRDDTLLDYRTRVNDINNVFDNTQRLIDKKYPKSKFGGKRKKAAFGTEEEIEDLSD